MVYDCEKGSQGVFTIDIDKRVGAKFTTFPDGQPHVNVSQRGGRATIICSMTSPSKLFELLAVANALDNNRTVKAKLCIPYLMGARSDRQMLPGDSVDLKIVAGLINGIGFDDVVLFDVHSDTAIQLVNRSRNVSNESLVRAYKASDAVVISPDAGSAKKVGQYFAWNPGLVDLVQCVKTRDMATGRLSLRVLEPGKCEGRQCVIIDDLCDGGATFVAIAEQIRPSHLTLIVTHGIFSKGVHAVGKHFNQIITSDSVYRDMGYDGDVVTVIPHELENA